VLDSGSSSATSKWKHKNKPPGTTSTSARKRQLQNQCPALKELSNKVFGTENVSGSIADWFGGYDKMEALIDTYLESELSVGRGNDIKAGEAPFSPLCKSLPLLDDACYLGTSDTGFLRKLVAKFLPFGDQIVANIEKFEEQLEKLEDIAEEEIENFYKPTETGSCAVLNEDMFGIYETPGSY